MVLSILHAKEDVLVIGWRLGKKKLAYVCVKGDERLRMADTIGPFGSCRPMLAFRSTIFTRRLKTSARLMSYGHTCFSAAKKLGLDLQRGSSILLLESHPSGGSVSLRESFLESRSKHTVLKPGNVSLEETKVM